MNNLESFSGKKRACSPITFFAGPDIWSVPSLILLLIFLLKWSYFGPEAQARPEYVMRYGFTRCTSCHVSPGGGGPRNSMGKAFGLRGYKQGPFSSQDLWSVDVRSIYYSNPDAPNTAKGGAGVMAGIVSANLPVTAEDEEESKAKLRAVLSHNVGGFRGGSPREVYLRWELKDDSEAGVSPQYVVLGRFLPPFGLMTDEHRTYTKLQTQNTWNQDLDMGALVSGNPLDSIHYDLAVMNGQKTAGAAFGDGNAATWGGLINMRWLKPGVPVAIGLSGIHYEKVKDQDSPSASSAYVMVNLENLISEKIKAVWMVEYVIAQGFNSNSSMSYFFTDTSYAETVKNSESRGIYSLLDWQYSERLSWLYKFDHLVVDRRFPADGYTRHGFGFKYYLGPNLFSQVRVERAQAGHPNEKNGTGMGATNAVWAYLQLSI